MLRVFITRKTMKENQQAGCKELFGDEGYVCELDRGDASRMDEYFQIRALVQVLLWQLYLQKAENRGR